MRQRTTTMRRFQKAINASALAGAFLPLAKGARIPSTADDDCAETRKAVLRAEACFRQGLDCFSVMAQMIRRR
jgi:hypothetical protein